jgi:predicted nucleic acid binding AN1-type Zn finger protein
VAERNLEAVVLRCSIANNKRTIQRQTLPASCKASRTCEKIQTGTERQPCHVNLPKKWISVSNGSGED